MEDKIYAYSTSPHVKTPRTTKKIMLLVCLSLLPTTITGIAFFGLKALLILLLSCASAVLSEMIFNLIAKKDITLILKEFDFSSLVTGILLGLALGVNYPWYAPVIGSAFAIIVVKMLFGGTGKNLVNPAVTGRIFIFMSFQAAVTAWIIPNGDLTTSATMLEDFLGGNLPTLSNVDLLLGRNVAGCIGETCKVALIAGGLFLAATGVINICYPALYIGVAGLFSVVLYGFDFAYFLPSILSGGLMFGAIFMVTDYTTTPNTATGNVIYFVFLGLLTAGLRKATGMESVSFAILLGNLIVPLIDKFVINRPFGHSRTRKEKAAKNA
ncbi:MAG: RnfABCDGE type electron transport complex subunit D [Clostridia bacterium]|nr:RnfABCDGE type electron transport complex subunit D [Clostridia bacterium]